MSLNQYNVIIYNDDTRPVIEKIAVQLLAETKEEARRDGERIAQLIIPMSKSAVAVEFRKEISK